jgi:hypothetical protein
MGLILLFPCVPGAFVILPRDSIGDGDDDDDYDDEHTIGQSVIGEEQSDEQISLTRRRLRTISAGVWHNALTAFVYALLIFTGFTNFAHAAMWKEINGLKVESVESSSPLFQHMPKGTLITRLDDFDLGQKSMYIKTASDRLQAWHMLLLEDGANGAEQLGWCVPDNVWQGE